MKKVMILLILVLGSCKPGNQTITSIDKKDMVLQYSKGPCLGRCPVYNLRVFTDGMVLYESRDAQRQKISVISQLSREEVGQLSEFLGNSLGEPTLFKKIRDRPVTVLKYDDKEYEYHATKIEGLLKQVNMRMEDLVAEVRDE